MASHSTIQRLFLVTIALLMVTACNPASEELPPSNTLKSGPWHAEIELPGGAARFGLEISRSADTWAATVINGSERISVPEASFEDGRLTLRFPAFNNRIDAVLDEGRLKGALTLVKRYGATQVIPFRASPGTRPSATKVASAAADLSGRWSVTFTEDDGSTYPAIGEFRQRGNKLLGTFLTETGDYRYLGGTMHGNEMRLATFDGAHAFLFSALLDENGQLTGNFWSGNASLESWTGKRNPDARLADPAALTFLKPGYERFEFSFPDTEGNPVSLDDERFQGKVVLVTLAGSWCPNCHDEAALMTQLYDRYREQGLEVIALMYEHLEDPKAAVVQVERFREKFGIKYTTLMGGISEKTLAAETLPALSAVLAFPTTIFIDRQAKVREIHTGFSGPGTGEHYENQKRKITTLIETLIAEGAASATPASAQ
ncbi:MAG: TlpA disulfide reductase family protein [Woeseiaceae bacterium]